MAVETTLTQQSFWKYYEHGREDDSWDYKQDIDWSSKKAFAAFVKDVLALSNFGGGHLLLGIRGRDKSLVGVKEEIDQASLGQKVESALGFPVDLKLLYFDHVDSHELRLGVIFIPASRDMLIAGKNLHDADGNLIIQEGDIYYRRNTRTVRARPEEIRAITDRTREDATSEAVNEFGFMAREQREYLDSASWRLSEMIDGRFEPSARDIGRKLKEIWNFCTKYSKFEFARAIGVAPDRIDACFDGEDIIDLPHLIGITKMFRLPPDYFLQPTYNMCLPFWREDIVRYAIMSLVTPKAAIADLTDPDRFCANVIYHLARGICDLHRLICGESPIFLMRDVASLPDDLRTNLSRQYYKLLEQYPRSSSRELTEPENIISLWFHTSANGIARIVIEGIEGIKISKSEGRPQVLLRFERDIRSGQVRFAGYDDTKLRMQMSRTNSTPARSV